MSKYIYRNIKQHNFYAFFYCWNENLYCKMTNRLSKKSNPNSFKNRSITSYFCKRIWLLSKAKTITPTFQITKLEPCVIAISGPELYQPIEACSSVHGKANCLVLFCGFLPFDCSCSFGGFSFGLAYFLVHCSGTNYFCSTIWWGDYPLVFLNVIAEPVE